MPTWISLAFVNRDRKLRNGWWLAAFFLVLAILLFPAILAAAHFKREVTLWEQLGLIAIATLVIQILRRKPVTEVTGAMDRRWIMGFGVGAMLGGLLMAIPALGLAAAGLARFELSTSAAQALANAAALMLAVALAEELLFRGVLFQRLMDGLGIWPAQVLTALLFVLTHLNNPGMEGATKVWAGCNIFLASILFGLTFVRTRSLAMPIGLHFMANVMQGVILGFGVSGESEPGLLVPHLREAPTWLTGGAFGLEASLPGLLTLLALLASLVRYLRPRNVADRKKT